MRISTFNTKILDYSDFLKLKCSILVWASF
jgi:hypothetical protein